MTDKATPEALRLADALYDGSYLLPVERYTTANELRSQHARIAELEAQIESVGAGGVQALSAAPAVPAGWKLVPVEPSVDQEWKGKEASSRVSSMAEACKIYKAMLAASPTPPAECITADEFRPCPCCFGAGVEGTADDYGHTIDVACGECNGSGRDSKPIPLAEQQAQPGAVDRTGCTAGTDEECTRRGCATSCPAAPKAAPPEGNWINADDVQRLVRQLDVLLNGESGAASQASLCDIVGQVAQAAKVLGRPVLDTPKAAPGEQQNCGRCSGSGEDPAGYYDQSRGDAGSTFDGPCRECNGTGAAPQQEAQEPVLFLSPEQLAALTEPDGAHGRYLPVRKTRRGMFTMPLYTAPQPAAPQAAPAVDEQMRKDARRYLWLRDKADYMRVKEGSPQVCLTDEWGCIVSDQKWAYPQGEKLDAAIDAALAVQGGA